MKKTRFDWSKKLELKNKEERKQLWDEINYQRYRDNVRRANAKMRPLLVLPYFLFSTLYTLYLSFYVPFFEFKKLSKIDFLVNLEGLKPLVAWIRKIFKAIEIDEPLLSVIGFIIFAVIIPSVLAVVIKKLIEKHNIKKCENNEQEFAETEKEQLNILIDAREEMVYIKNEHKSKLFNLLMYLVLFVNLFIFIVGRLSAGADAKVDNGFTIVTFLIICFLALNLLAGHIFKKVSADNTGGMSKNFIESFYAGPKRIDEIEEKEEREAEKAAELKQNDEWLAKIKKGLKYLENKEYLKAENELYKIRRYYDKKEEEYIYWSNKSSKAYWANDEDEMYACNSKALKISHENEILEDNIADINIGLSMATFFKRKNKTDLSIAVVLGIIDRNYKKIKDAVLKATADKFNAEHKEKFMIIAEEEYAVAADYMSDGDMSEAKKHLALPNILNYKDSETLYAMLRLIVDNNPAEYDEIQLMLVNTKEKVISEVHKGAVEDAISEIGKTIKARGKMISKSYRVVSYYNTYKTLESAGLSSGAGANLGIGSSTNSKTGSDASSSAITADEADFMDWAIGKNKAIRDYEEKIKNGESALNPIGDSDFPKDVETFPSSDEIW